MKMAAEKNETPPTGYRLVEVYHLNLRDLGRIIRQDYLP
jgi:hypothetical protein